MLSIIHLNTYARNTFNVEIIDYENELLYLFLKLQRTIKIIFQRWIILCHWHSWKVV